MLDRFFRRPARSRRTAAGFSKIPVRPARRRLRHEPLEDRRLLSITWVNDGADNFAAVYGANADLARQIVRRAIDDWETIIVDFNHDGDNNVQTRNDFALTLNAAALASTTARGATTNIQFTQSFEGGRIGIPKSATVTLDDNAGGAGWYFDPTPRDDAEFTAIVADFEANFIDVSRSSSGYADLYTTALHHIGHAVGFSLAQDSAAFLFASAGEDDPNSADPIDQLRTFNFNGTRFTLTTAEGGSFYEGPAPAISPDIETHPNDLMTPLRTLAASTTAPPILNPVTRRLISDEDANFLISAFGYSARQPSTLANMHMVLDPETGLLLVQGNATRGRTDAISATLNTTTGAITVSVDLTPALPTSNVNDIVYTRTFSANDVTKIIVDGNGGNDTVNVTNGLDWNRVDYVVSSNQDSLAPTAQDENRGNGQVDLDPNVGGRQITLRAAVRDAGASAVRRTVFIPRGRYQLTLNDTAGTEVSGTVNNAVGDLDITRDMGIVGAGAGATVIDASTLTVRDRIFQVNSNGTLELSRVTLTGGSGDTGGGAIRVTNNTTATKTELILNQVAIVGNTATGSVAVGGGVYVLPGAIAQIRRSVITGNTAGANGGGGVHSGGNASAFATVVMDQSIIAKNTSNNSPNLKSGGPAGQGRFSSQGGNLFDDIRGSLFASPNQPGLADLVGAVDLIVTDLRDDIGGLTAFDHTDDGLRRSIRDAIHTASTTAGAQTIWLPAWDYFLSRTRTEGQTETDADLTTGDLEIDNQVTIRGSAVAGSTSVGWSTAVVDTVFDLVGDFDGNGAVDALDVLIWQRTLGSTTDLRADADRNSTVEAADHALWLARLGQTSIVNVTVTPRPTTLPAAAVSAGAASDSAAQTVASASLAEQLAGVSSLSPEKDDRPSIVGRRSYRPR